MLVALAVAAALAACAARDPAAIPDPASGPTPLVATTEIPGEFLMQQRLRFRWRDAQGQVDAVVQQVCGEFTVLLLTPFGTPGVVIRQRGLDVSVQSKLADPLAFPPEYILRDVQRTYFVPLGEPPLEAGRRTLDFGDEAIEERWERGRLIERSFIDGASTPVVITYPDGMTRDTAPRRASIDAVRWGYHLDVETLSRVELKCPE